MGRLTPRQVARLDAANRARFETETELLLPAVRAALGMYLAALNRRVDQSAFGLAAPAPATLVAAAPIEAPTSDNPHHFTTADAVQLQAVFDHAAPEWAAAMDTTLMPGMRTMLARIAVPVEHPTVVKAVEVWRSEWLTERTQILVGVPDTITAEIRFELDRLATEHGTSVFDAKNAVKDLLSPDRLDWEAQRIARTEVTSANNNAMLASWRSLIGTLGAGVTARKTWVGGQRPTHSAVSGTTIGIDEKFRVGDSEMDGPGDSAGGAAECANCACSMHFEIDDSPASGSSDGADQTATVTASAARADELVLTAAGDTPNTGACLMAYLSSEDAARLAVPGGEPPENLHVTLAYLDRPASDFPPDEQAEIDAAFAAAWVGPITADAFGTALFNPDSEERDPCAVLLVQSDDLSNARDALISALDTVPIGSPVGLDKTFPIWIPHTAIAYNAAGASVIAPGSTGPLTYDRLVMAWGEDKHDLTSGAATPDPEPESAQVLTAATQEQPMTAPTDTPPAPVADPTAEPTGPTWSGPLALLGVPSSDNRKLGPNGTVRPLPQPLNWQHKSAKGHDGSSIVGRILTVEIRDGMVFGHGDWLPGYNEDVERARQQVDGGLGLVSVDAIPGVVSFEDRAGNPIDPASYTGAMEDVVVLFDEWELAGVTLVSLPAFAGVRIVTDPGTETDDDLMGGPLIMPGQTETFAGENPAAPTVSDDVTSVTLPDGTVVSIGDPVTFPGEDGTDTAGTITAIDPAGLTVTVALTPDADADADDGAEPVTVTVPIADLTPAGPPVDGTPAAAPAFSATTDAEVDVLLASSFANPYPAGVFAKRELLGPTPLTLNRETGEVYGHFAQWGECHLGKLAQDGVCTTAPQSAAGYDYFHLGEVITDDGPLPVGKITVGGGHAGPRVGFRGAVEHYDRTCSQVAVVRAYDDAYGGQFTGMLIPGVSDEKVEEMMRAGQLSGDWRMVKGNLELVAALAVNVPGFPVKRPATKYGMIGDRQVSLVAAGMVIPEENTDVVLPSGQTLPRSDWDALVAATFTAIQQHTAAARTPEPEVQALPVVDQLALRRATARLALLDSEAV